MRLRASGRWEPAVVGLNRIGFSIAKPLFASPSTNVNAVYGELRKCFTARALTFVDGRLRSCTLSGVECHNSSGAKHRSCSDAKLNAGSRIQYVRRTRGLHPGYRLLCRLFRCTIARAFRNEQPQLDPRTSSEEIARSD